MKREYVDTPENRQYVELRNMFYQDVLNGRFFPKWKKLLSCKAEYCDYRDFTFLRSYNTIVAVFNKYNNMLISYGRYSSTTYQHIRKFRDNVCGGYNIKERNLEYENWY